MASPAHRTRPFRSSFLPHMVRFWVLTSMRISSCLYFAYGSDTGL